MPRARYEESPPELAYLGKALRELRESAGLKQIEVGTAAGVTESQISDIERGKNNPGWRLIARIVNDGLGLTIRDFADAYMRAQEES